MDETSSKKDESQLSEADDEKDVNYSDKEASDVEDTDEKSKKKYKCTEPGCNARFLRPSRLTWHLRKHKDERPYKCSVKGCTRAYTNSSHLKRHENSHKPITKVYECPDCLLEVGSLFSLKRHRKMIHDPTRLTCEECGAKFRKKHCYAEHMSMHAGVSLYKCEVCKSEYPTLRLLKKHQISHKTKNYTCKSAGCNKVFDKWSQLGKHMEKEHQFDRKCDKCDKRFKHKNQLNAHMAGHESANSLIPCPYKNCPKFYTHQKNLDAHLEVFHQGQKFYCDACKNGFTSKASLVRHIRLIHESVSPEKRKESKRPRRRRRDAGMPKSSMAIKLSGLKLPYEMEKEIVHRKPIIVLENRDISSLKNSKEKERENIPEECSETKNEEMIGVDLISGKFVKLQKKIASESSSCETMPKKGETIVEKGSHSPVQIEKKPLSLAEDLVSSKEPYGSDNGCLFNRNDEKLDLTSESMLEEPNDKSDQVEMELSLLASDLLSENSTTIIDEFLEKCADKSDETDLQLQKIMSAFQKSS